MRAQGQVKKRRAQKKEMVQYLKMKLARRQFRGFQSAESGTRHGGRPRGQAEAYFFIRTCSDHASSPCPCPRHPFTCQNRVMFRCKPSIGVFPTCACSNAARVQLRFTFFSHHFGIEFRIGLGECRRERESNRAATMNGGMTKWPIAHLENVGKGICHAIRLFHQSRHWAADPSLLVTAEPKPLRLPLVWNAGR